MTKRECFIHLSRISKIGTISLLRKGDLAGIASVVYISKEYDNYIFINEVMIIILLSEFYDEDFPFREHPGDHSNTYNLFHAREISYPLASSNNKGSLFVS